MAAQLQFRDVTLGYDRHPAVHHLDGEVAAGALLAVVGPNGAGKSTLFRGLVGILKPLAGSIALGGLDVRDIAYLPQTVDIDRSFPISVFDFVGTGLWRTIGLFGGMGKAAREKIAQALAAVGLNGFENRPHRHAVRRADAAHAVRAGAAAGRAPDRAGRALQRHRRQNLGRSAGAGAALARREAHGAGGAARHGSGARQFPGNPAAGARAGGLGRDREVLTAENLLEARRMCEAFDDSAAACAGRRPAVAGRLTVMIYDALIAPFTEFEFMRRALAAVIALALGGAPIGVFLMLRRMSLVGDAMAHAILPGAAIGFLLSGLNLFAMTTGGLIAGFTVAILAGVVARTTELKEDASLATFYLVSLALGVTIVSIKGTNIDLLHVLFGNILAMDDQTLLVIAFNATITLIVLAVIFRPLVIESVDPVFLRTVSRAGAPAHLAFLALVVINLVNGFHALGTLAGGRADDPAGRHRAVLVARHHRHDLHRGRERDRVGLCRAGAVVPDQGAVGAGDHPGGGGALCRLGAVRQRQRPGPADVSRPAS